MKQRIQEAKRSIHGKSFAIFVTVPRYFAFQILFYCFSPELFSSTQQTGRDVRIFQRHLSSVNKMAFLSNI